MKRMQDLEKYYKVLFDEAVRIDKVNRWLEGFFVAIALGANYTNGFIVYALTVVGVIIQIWVYANKKIQKNYEILAHKIEEYSMIYTVYKKDTFNFEVSHIIGNFKPKLHKLVVDSPDNPESSHYLAPEQAPNRLIWMVQENSFWNTHLFRYSYQKSLIRIIIIFILTMVAFLCSIALLSKYGGIIDVNFLFPRTILLILTANFLWNELDKVVLWYSASENMLEIDNSVARQKDFSQDYGLHIFAYYNVIKTIAPPIEEKLYKKHEAKINLAWSARFNQLYNDKQYTTKEN